MSVDTRPAPTGIHQMLLFRLGRYLGTAGALAVRMCEAHFGITRRQWVVMATVADHEGLLSSELAERVQLDRSRTSRALTGLEVKGWVQRTPLPGDHRRVAVSLTEQGRRMYEVIMPRMAQIHLDLVAVLDDEEVRQLDALLARLHGQARALEHEDRYGTLPRLDRARHRR